MVRDQDRVLQPELALCLPERIDPISGYNGLRTSIAPPCQALCYGYRYDGSCFFDVWAYRQKFDKLNGSLVYRLLDKD